MGAVGFVPQVLAVVLVAGWAWSGSASPVSAQDQDATPLARQAPVPTRLLQIRTGSCGALGDLVVPLTDLAKPTGDWVGQSGGLTAEASLTNVPLPLDQILASDLAISATRSADADGAETSIACGNVGGVVDANRALVIGLLPQNGSGFAGVAYLGPGVAGGTTDVSVFLVDVGGAERGVGREGTSSEATPGNQG